MYHIKARGQQYTVGELDIYFILPVNDLIELVT